MRFYTPLLLLLAAATSLVEAAPTIHQCIINGVRTFQDSPCPKVENPAPQNAAGLANQQKITMIRQHRQDLVRQLRNLTLQRQQALADLERRQLLNDEDPPKPGAKAELDTEYQRRFDALRQRVADLDRRLERLQAP